MLTEEIIDLQLKFYNNHDLDGFLSTYHDDIIIYDLSSGEAMLEGKEALKAKYSIRFEKQKVHADIKNRIVLGSKVIDHEYVTTIDSTSITKAVAIYEISEGQIKKVWFLFE